MMMMMIGFRTASLSQSIKGAAVFIKACVLGFFSQCKLDIYTLVWSFSL